MSKDVGRLAAELGAPGAGVEVPLWHLVVSLVQRGTITSQEAESWARDVGEEPFAHSPDPATYDPMADPDWTLAMATAWIIWRTPDAVRSVWERFAPLCRFWVVAAPDSRGDPSALRRTGHDLRDGEARTPRGAALSALMDIGLAKGRDAVVVPHVPPMEAEGLLRAALRKGVPLLARHGSRLDEIEPRLWGVLSPFSEGKGPHDGVFNELGEVQFRRVRVDRDAVLAVWPALNTIAAKPAEAAEVASEPTRQGRISDTELHAFLKTLPIEPRMTRVKVIEVVRGCFGDRAPGERRIKQAYGRHYQAALRPGDKPTSNVSVK